MNTLIKMWAPWCGPCKMMSPLVDEYASEKQLDLRSVNVDDEPDMVTKYNVRGVPTMVLVDENGTEITRFVGFASKTKMEEHFAPHL